MPARQANRRRRRHPSSGAPAGSAASRRKTSETAGVREAVTRSVPKRIAHATPRGQRRPAGARGARAARGLAAPRGTEHAYPPGKRGRPAEPARERAAMDTKAIVIVEDNEPVARLLQEVLNDEPGYGAVTVRRRRAGPGRHRRRPPRPGDHGRRPARHRRLRAARPAAPPPRPARGGRPGPADERRGSTGRRPSGAACRSWPSRSTSTTRSTAAHRLLRRPPPGQVAPGAQARGVAAPLARVDGRR